MAEIKLILSRDKRPDETLGTYFVMKGYEMLYSCRVVERAWLNNKKNESCIPDGVYDVIKYSDAKHPNTFWIKDVPGRDGILIHHGNFATGAKIDTTGCQVPGLAFLDIDGNGTPDVAATDPAMAALNYFLPDKFKIIIC